MADRIPPAGPTRADGRIGRRGRWRPALPHRAAAQDRRSLTLQAKADVIALRPGQPDTPIWSLQDTAPARACASSAATQLEVSARKRLPVPACLNWHGIDGVPAAEAAGSAAAARPWSHGKFDDSIASRRHPPVRLSAVGRRPGAAIAARALIVGESEPVAVDRDEVFLIEDWRLRPDGSRDHARHRSQGHDTALHRQRAGERSILPFAPTND